MADKKGPEVVTVIITVDLECPCCAKKIKRTVCKLQKRFKINSIVFDEKKNTVTVSGPFDPHAFIKQLRCMAGRVIKDVQIKKPDPPKPQPPPPPKPTPPPPPPPPPCLPSCSPPCWSPCSPPCRPPCSPPCPKLCPPPCRPPCPPPCPKPCPPPCLHPCPPQRPHPLPDCHQPCTCNEPSPDCGGCRPCETPWPPIAPWPPILPRPTPPKCNSGFPCYKVVCEPEPPGCSFM